MRGRHLRIARPALPAPLARNSSRVSAPSAAPVSRILCRTGAPRSATSVLGSSTKSAEAPTSRWCEANPWVIAGVEGGGDGAVGHGSQVGEVEFQARFRVQRHHLALGDSQAGAGRRRFRDRLQVLVPGKVRYAVAGRLVERRGVAVTARGILQYLGDGASGHLKQFNTWMSGPREPPLRQRPLFTRLGTGVPLAALPPAFRFPAHRRIGKPIADRRQECRPGPCRLPKGPEKPARRDAESQVHPAWWRYPGGGNARPYGRLPLSCLPVDVEDSAPGCRIH